MIMIRHKTEGVTDPSIILDNIREDGKKTEPISVIKKNRLAGVSPGGYMVEGTGILNS
jgi:hypothetical protein